MRTLRIKRKKKFVGSFAALDVYIEDYETQEVSINGRPCRKLGTLKNGEEATFEIGEHSARVYATAGKILPNYVYEFYEIPAGREDVTLTGENKANPFEGNPFRFDNNNHPDIITARKSSKQKAIKILLSAVAGAIGASIAIICGTLLRAKDNPKTFEDNGVSITLTDKFVEKDYAGYTMTYYSADAMVLFLKEPFALMSGLENYTLTQYANLVIQNNNVSATVMTEDGLTGFEYNATPDGTHTYQYDCFVFKTDDAFWLVQFAVKESKAERMDQTIEDWAASIEFAH